MFSSLFFELKAAKVPVTLKEYLTLIEAVDADVAGWRVEDFYVLARTVLIKDERHLDIFDRVFSHVFKGLELLAETAEATIPAEWLKLVSELHLTDAEKATIEAMGGWDKIMDELRKRLAEQEGRHQGGNKWIGTGGTSPYGAYGYNPAGVRIGQKESRHRRAIKVWDKREFKDLASDVEIGTRNFKVALRKLRRLARDGRPEELDLEETIRGTAHKGYLDIHLRAERRNAVNVLMFLDVGGSMDWHVRDAEELFSAARSEFKHLRSYYFHNCLYEYVWQDNARRFSERTPTWDILHTFPADTKVIFVGDAAMSPYEITVAGGSVEHMNPEPGAEWLKRVTGIYDKCVWLNPLPQEQWAWTSSIGMIERLVGGRMFPLTIDGLERAIRALMR